MRMQSIVKAVRRLQQPFRWQYLFLKSKYRNEYFHFYLCILLCLFLVVSFAEGLFIYMLLNGLTFGEMYWRVFALPPLPPLIDTATCKVADWPALDLETQLLFVPQEENSSTVCTKSLPPFTIRRVNYTYIEIQYPNTSQWYCIAVNIERDYEEDFVHYGDETDRLGRLTNLANNNSLQLWREDPSLGDVNETNARWDSAIVLCNKLYSSEKFSRVVPLIQHYQPQETVPSPSNRPKMNVLLLGIDSISRLQFLRHLKNTKKFIDDHGFMPMYGYHKVGENSFPNVLPILSGYHKEHFLSDSPNLTATFVFDNVPLIFKEFRDRGYLTTYIEDMPFYGFFNYDTSGFYKQPTDYYLRPTNWAIETQRSGPCYQEKFECEHYYEYILDQLDAFRARGNQSYFIFNHESTLTHDYFNRAGYLDQVLHDFFQRLFAAGHNENTVIFLFSDHAIRWGPSLRTASHIYEERLPAFYMYLPESLSLDGLDVQQLRAIAAVNAHRLTSHFDLHATMMHLLNEQVPVPVLATLPYGRSLLREISANRTCAMAGIPVEYCLCNSMRLIKVDEQVTINSQHAVKHINALISPGNYCVPLKLDTIFKAFNATDEDGQHYQLLHFYTSPNEAIFEVFIQLSNNSIVPTVKYITRMDGYADSSSCIGKNRILAPLCYCWETYAK